MTDDRPYLERLDSSHYGDELDDDDRPVPDHVEPPEQRDDTVPVDDPPNRMLGNLLIDGPDGKCAYIYAGIGERCQESPDAHTYVEHGDDWVRVEMCAEHAREEVPTFDEWKQEVLRS
jgi:hypothetical protein